MPLPMPRLDNRTFDELVGEAQALLPRLAPGWTDYNLHDPGITLIDLLAWLVEMDLYRLDRTSPAAVRAFLRLVGTEPRPPQVAETVLVLSVKSGNTAVPLPAGVQVASGDDRTRFQTARHLLVCPTQLSAVLAGPEEARVDWSDQNRSAGRRFAPFGPDPRQDDALYLGLDRPLPAKSGRVGLYVWVHSPDQDRAERQKLIAECRSETSRSKACCSSRPCHRRSVWQHYSARTVWEYYARTEEWLPLARVLDETRGLTLSGAVRFDVPNNPHVKGSAAPNADLYFIRCRLTGGFYECPPEIARIALNAVTARHVADADVSEEQEETSNGRAGQVVRLLHSPVVPGSTRVQVQGDGDGWHEAPDWDRMGAHERAYVLSPESGVIRFGDGRRGHVPKAGAKIEVTRYQVGGGSDGNVPAGTLTKCECQQKIGVDQPFAATGGADAEAPDDAKGRAVAWLTDPQRAVTLDDFERFALATPGVPVKRAHALPDYDPALPDLPALGSVTVVVVPACALPIPEPGPDMLCAVARSLDRRRTLTTELHVVGPSFITVAVRATLHAGPEADARVLIAEAQSRLSTFLDPLRGGADGQGWPMGRDVYQSEVMALLNAIPGVTYVDEVGLLVESGLDVYQGYVRWMQVLKRAGSTTTVRAELRIEPHQAASRLLAQAQAELERYFQSPPGRTTHRSQKARCSDVIAILAAVPGVTSVEQVRLDDGPGSGALCGNVPVCAHGLIVPGEHQITASGARTGQVVRAAHPPC
jgi:predicted phage baseplate assembly protein